MNFQHIINTTCQWHARIKWILFCFLSSWLWLFTFIFVDIRVICAKSRISPTHKISSFECVSLHWLIFAVSKKTSRHFHDACFSTMTSSILSFYWRNITHVFMNNICVRREREKKTVFHIEVYIHSKKLKLKRNIHNVTYALS